MIVVPSLNVTLRKLVKWFYVFFAVAAISLAAIVQAGRSFSPLLAKYPKEVSRYFSSHLNAKVSIGSLAADWQGLKPMLDIRDLRITSQANEPIIALSSARMRLDLLDSLVHFRLVWSSLTLNQVEMEFAQSADGLWHIPGIPQTANDGTSARPDLLIDMLLLSGHIEFEQSELIFTFMSGDKTVMKSPLLKMENLDDFHRLAIQVDVDNHPKTLSILIEGRGDPRKRETFTSKGYIQFSHFPTTEPIAAVTALVLKGINAEVHSEGSIDAELWFKSRANHEGYDLTGRLGVERLSLPIASRKLALDAFSADLVGYWLYRGQWQFALQNIGANINQHKIEKVNFAASATAFDAPVTLHMQRLDVQHVHAALSSAGVLGDGHLRDVIQQLDPHGELLNIELAIPIGEPTNWQLAANLRQLGANAWQGVPALSNVDGYVVAGQRGGHVDIDSRAGFSMHYYPTYAAPMEYRQTRGQVAWWLQPENNQIYVNSGALEFINGDEKARGYMWLAMPWTHGTGDIDLYLDISAQNLPASLYTKYTPAVIPQSLLTWLANSIGSNNSGFVRNVGFTYRGTLNNHDHAARSHQLYLDLEHAQLNYHPEWPALENINGRLLVSDDDVDASVDSAKLYSSDVGPTSVAVFPNPMGKGSLLTVQGKVTGSTLDGLRVLHESMLHRYIGNGMDSWTLEGNMDTRLDLRIPLDSASPGSHQQVDIDLHAPIFEIGNLKLHMRDINGHISYNDSAGLSSDGLQAILFNEPIRAHLGTRKYPEFSQTLIDINGEVDSNTLAIWSQRPEALFLRGKIPYVAHVELNHRQQSTDTASASPTGRLAAEPFAVVDVKSMLDGVAVNLPAPYGKATDGERPLVFTMSLREQSSLINVTYADNLQAVFDLEPLTNKLHNANIALDSTAELADTPQFLLSGKLPTFDLEPWKKVQAAYMNYVHELDSMDSADNSGATPTQPVSVRADDTLVAGLPFRAKVNLDHYQVGPLALRDIDVQAQHLIEGWKVQFSNPVVMGSVLLREDRDQPLDIQLDNLHLTRAILEPAATSVDAAERPVNIIQAETTIRGPSIDPRSLPVADISVRELYLDDKNYGNWSLQIRPNDQGALFDNIHGSIRGITVAGADDDTKGAKLNWQLTDSGPRTHFIGSLSATDIAAVLLQWQKPDMLESTHARFRVDASWGGDPQDFTLKNLTGSTHIWLEKGRFKRNPGAGSDGFLRLLAVLNFDSLSRRLRLDFTDLYKSGLAYDEIVGIAEFEPGTMTFNEPLVVRTPSSRLQMAGSLDLNREKINARLVATLPVAGNLTFAAALATGLPAAAGIYLVSKLFKKQVDQATSISYRIHGGWDDPKMNFDRLFESEETLRDSVNAPAPIPLTPRKPQKSSSDAIKSL